MIYFDYNSTAPYSPSVRKYLEQAILEDWYNPSSVYSQSQILDQKIRECRTAIANHLNCSSKHLFFTSGGTESINTILSLDTLRLNQITTLITSFLEHHATIKKINYLSECQNIQTIWTNNNKQGEINLNHLEEICSKHPHSLLSFLSANNETGVISDIQAISKIVRKYNCLIHIDAVQSFGKTKIDLEEWDVDFVSFSGHKIGAMKGIGLLYAKKPLAPLMYGGGQERGLRPGTYNFPAIYSLKLAVQDIDFQKWENVRKLRDHFEDSLLYEKNYEKESNNLSNTPSVYKTVENYLSTFKVNCQKANRLPNTSNIYCGGMSNQAVLLNLAQKGICVSVGSACNVASPEPSHVLTAIANLNNPDHSKNYARSCMRVSLSPSNTKEEVNFLIQSLKALDPSAPYINIHPQSQSL